MTNNWFNRNFLYSFTNKITHLKSYQTCIKTQNLLLKIQIKLETLQYDFSRQSISILLENRWPKKNYFEYEKLTIDEHFFVKEQGLKNHYLSSSKSSLESSCSNEPFLDSS